MNQAGFDLQVGMELSGAGIDEVWWRYVALGGSADRDGLAARVRGSVPCDRLERNLIAQVLNEIFLDRGVDTYPVVYAEIRSPDHVSMSAGDPRQRAREAKRRSAVMALQAAALHSSAARLMQSSGQLQLARRAGQRSSDARVRAARSRVATA